MSVPGIQNHPAQAQRELEIEGNPFIPGFTLSVLVPSPCIPLLGLFHGRSLLQLCE